MGAYSRGAYLSVGAYSRIYGTAVENKVFIDFNYKKIPVPDFTVLCSIFVKFN